jgi:hypothetical protein
VPGLSTRGYSGGSTWNLRDPKLFLTIQKYCYRSSLKCYRNYLLYIGPSNRPSGVVSIAESVPHSTSRTNSVSLIMKPLVPTVASTNSMVHQRNDAYLRITNSLNWVKLQLEARFSRCSIWIIFLVVSLFWRRYCSHENLGSDSLSQSPTA